MNKTIQKLQVHAEKYNLMIKELKNGHVQIIGGPLLVNYYPFSDKRTAYIAGTKKGIENVSMKKAIKMAITQPDVIPKDKKDKRSRQEKNKKIKKQLLKIRPNCEWCNRPLNQKTVTTLEHIIPLHRGGLNNRNNMTLACEECNNERGHNMIEIEKKVESEHLPFNKDVKKYGRRPHK